ncbi:hypothetical protein THTE_0558 [Thermogutta terrifontis]|uniref:Uncharacterized protein n=1 Tax=Thermogutta terrifontis TaxID=1331910 RepID=A0A286RB19_9BACT|nr:hypothetical protein THTE_0558 [Thermogutta terrifontis]
MLADRGGFGRLAGLHLGPTLSTHGTHSPYQRRPFFPPCCIPQQFAPTPRTVAFPMEASQSRKHRSAGHDDRRHQPLKRQLVQREHTDRDQDQTPA